MTQQDIEQKAREIAKPIIDNITSIIEFANKTIETANAIIESQRQQMVALEQQIAELKQKADLVPDLLKVIETHTVCNNENFKQLNELIDKMDELYEATDCLTKQIAEKDEQLRVARAEIERLRNDRGLLPVCKVDQELLAANATCRQQAEMIGILQAEVERHKSSVKELESIITCERESGTCVQIRQCKHHDPCNADNCRYMKSLNHPGETP